jgi:uncharacterized Zn-finger protein
MMGWKGRAGGQSGDDIHGYTGFTGISDQGGYERMMTASSTDGKAGSNSAGGSQTETVFVTSDRVACDGNGDALGHPRVWLTLGTDGEIVCPYCSRRYVRAGDEDDV